MRVEKVFTPSGYPDHTYVKQEEKSLEDDITRGIHTPGEIVSLSGPSKSGKTVLVQRVTDENSLIIIQGSGINSPQDLWDAVIDELDLPSIIESTSGETEEITGGSRGGIKSWIPGLTASIEGFIENRLSKRSETTETYHTDGLSKVINKLIEEDYVLLIDDFHYIERDVQSNIAEEIKEAARRDISICVALVPHRTDDLVRANSDLRGRVQTLDVGYWDQSDLEKIAYKGFDILNVDFSEEAIKYLAQEATGSPQLMQRLCLEACYETDIEEQQEEEVKITVNKSQFLDILYSTAEYAEHGSTFDVLNSGPKTRGTRRLRFDFGDGNSGDVYKCILRAIASDPPKRTITYEQLKNRTNDQCTGENFPTGSSIVGSCKKMDELVKERFPDQRSIEWDDTKQSLHIPDPYLLFYLRWSGRLNIRDI